MPAAPETTPTTNDIPDELLDLAKDAMSRGFSTVSLAFGYLSADFPAPISWMLWLHKTNARTSYQLSNPTSTLDAQRAAFDVEADGTRHIDTHAAYVGHRPPELTGGKNYWHLDQIRTWLDEPVTAEGLLPGWTPVTDDAQQKMLLHDWSDFERAARSGWGVTRTIDTLLHDDPRSTTLSLEATNNFYNVKGHPQHRSTGAALTRHVWRTSTLTATAPWHTEPGALSEVVGGQTVTLTGDAAERIISSTAPWFVPVASTTPDTEDTPSEWTLPTEATTWPTD